MSFILFATWKITNYKFLNFHNLNDLPLHVQAVIFLLHIWLSHLKDEWWHPAPPSHPNLWGPFVPLRGEWWLRAAFGYFPNGKRNLLGDASLEGAPQIKVPQKHLLAINEMVSIIPCLPRTQPMPGTKRPQSSKVGYLISSAYLAPVLHINIV